LFRVAQTPDNSRQDEQTGRSLSEAGMILLFNGGSTILPAIEIWNCIYIYRRCLSASCCELSRLVELKGLLFHFLVLSITLTMGILFYVTIEHSTHSNRCPHHCSGVAMESVVSEPTVETLRRYCPAQTLANCWELLFALFSSIILTAYTLHHEVRVRNHLLAPLTITNGIN
jgi:hypothetical protein